MNKKALLIIAAACMFSGAALACENPPCGPAKASPDSILTGKTVKKTTKATPAQPAAEKILLACDTPPCGGVKASPDSILTGKSVKKTAKATHAQPATEKIMLACDNEPCTVKSPIPAQQKKVAFASRPYCDTPPCDGN